MPPLQTTPPLVMVTVARSRMFGPTVFVLPPVYPPTRARKLPVAEPLVVPPTVDQLFGLFGVMLSSATMLTEAVPIAAMFRNNVPSRNNEKSRGRSRGPPWCRQTARSTECTSVP